MQTEIYSRSPEATRTMDTRGLRDSFLVPNIFAEGAVRLTYWETDRTILGGAVPTDAPLVLSPPEVVGASHLCARREVGVINLGGAGSVTVDGERHSMATHDGLYIGQGSEDVAFASEDAAAPARFYLLSYPAHQKFPTTHIPHASVEPVELGSPETANERKLYKVIHPGSCQSCQLVMGHTRLLPGSVWNTMPAHTHVRRSEVYLYFAIPEDAFVVHLMGRPDETRHLMVRNHEVVLSPSWSIHSGAGTAGYGFVWGMGGENQDFGDMQGVQMSELF